MSSMKRLALILASAAAMSACSRGPTQAPAESGSTTPAPMNSYPAAEKLLAEASNNALPPLARKNYANMILSQYPGSPEAKRAKELLPEIEASLIGSQWNYSNSEDAMTGARSASATTHSTNTFEFDFPYMGTQRATLMLRKHPSHGNDVIFYIENGQIRCSSYSCPIRVRFDESPPKTYEGVESADNDSTTVFIPAYSTFIRELQKAKIVRIEFVVFRQGVNIAEFDVSGFKPDKLD